MLVTLLLAAGVLAPAQAQTTSIYDIQYTEDPWGDSPLEWAFVTISGTVVATDFYGYVVAEAPGPWNSIYVAEWNNAPAIGDEIIVSGMVYEDYGMTLLVGIADYTRVSSNNPVEATPVGVAEASQEQYESVLITVGNVAVAALLSYGEWVVADAAGYLICDDMNDYVYFPKLGDQLESVTGTLVYTYGDFKLEPRATYDITGDPIPHYALHGRVVTMNDTREIVGNAYIEIIGDQIKAIHSKRPKGIPVIQTGGLIFPGLIDSHNHPVYNGLGTIPFGELFTERYEWQSHPVYDDFGDQRDSILHYGGPYAQYLNSMKLAEVRALTAGTTSIQGNNCNGDQDSDYAHQGIVVNNVERYPALVLHDTFPLRGTPSDVLDYWTAASTENWERFIVHLSEGTSASALDEFYQWKDDLGMLDARTTLIHGVPLGDAEWAAMAAAGASIVWSPVSNLTLYGSTANIPGALAAGVNVALAPDWTESGSPNILEEMKEADRLNQEEWGGVITPLQFAEFVTCNAAKAVGNQRFLGQITPGYRANLMVIPGSIKKPYRTLLRAEPADVKLAVVDGVPRYGSLDVLAKFSFLNEIETVLVGGVEKGLAIQVESHSIPGSDKPFLDILSELEEAYAASTPKVCEFVGIE